MHHSARDDFRLFYNQSIYPELLHLERRRQNLVRLIVFSALVLAGLFFLAVFVDVLVLTLLFLLAAGIWAGRLVFKVQVFLNEFKPRIVGLVLDFIDNDINYGTFSYHAKKFISKEKFFESCIFTHADEYVGEDYISGTIREMPIEFSELTVTEISPVRNKIDRVFKGVFLVGDFKKTKMHGKILMIPDNFRKYLSRTERAFHLQKGVRVNDNLLPEFEFFFDTYATPDARVKTVLSEDMQRALIEYRKKHGKDIYVSIIEDKIYLAVSQNKDLLEPMLFASNMGFEVVREFYEDIKLLLSVIHDVDVMN